MNFKLIRQSISTRLGSGRSMPWIHAFVEIIISSKWMHNQSSLSPSRIQYSQALEYAPLLWDLAFLPDTTFSCSTECEPTPWAWGLQHACAACDSGRTPPWIRAFVEVLRSKDQSGLSPSWIKYSRALEYAPLLWDLAFLPDTTCSCSAAY